MKKKLERKRFRIKDENGNYIGKIGAVSMVTKPAIEKAFDLFDTDLKWISVLTEGSDS